MSDDATNPLTGLPYSQRYYKILEGRERLPVFGARSKILKLLMKYQVVLLVGDTGSGKSTNVPQFILDLDPIGKIACTQPRRVAAMSVAERVSEELDVQLGQEVGYSIRFDDKSCARTRIKYLTDGMLLREAMDDPLLSQYSVIVLDEAHERTVATDILLGWVKEACEKRGDLRVVVMSATLEEEKFQQFFPRAPTIHVTGRMYGVEVYCSKAPESNYVEAAIRTATQIHLYEGEGDILIFMTGEEEIETVCERLENGIPYAVDTAQSGAGDSLSSTGVLNIVQRRVEVLPLYSALPPHQQKKVFRKTSEGTRKIVVATNIAETSLTIDGVVFVIDSGFSKQKVYNPKKRVESLLVTPISRASADQRMGRAGRTRPGKCFRLYTRDAYDRLLIPQSHPEILRSNLGAIVLNLKRMGVDDLVHFDFVDPPAPHTLMRALELLNWLGALNDDGDLTDRGRLMSRFPVEPETAAMLLNAPALGVGKEMCHIAAMLNIQSPFVTNMKDPRSKTCKEQWKHTSGDHISLLQTFDAFVAAISGAGGKVQHVSYKYSDDVDGIGGDSAAGGGGASAYVQQWCRENYLNFRAMSQARSISSQLWGIMRDENLLAGGIGSAGTTRHHNPISDWHEVSGIDTNVEKANNIRKAVLSGYFCNVAMSLPTKKQYQTLKEKQKAMIFPGSFLDRLPAFVVYNEVVLTSNDYLRTVTAVTDDWIVDACPAYFSLEEMADDPLGLQAMKNIYRSRERSDKLKAQKQKEAASSSSTSALASRRGRADSSDSE